MVQTKMATETEVEGKTTVSVPPEVEAGLEREQASPDENQTAPPTTEEVKTEEVAEEVAPQSETESEGEDAQPTRKERRLGEFVDKLKTKDKELSALREELDTLKGVPRTPTGQVPSQPRGFGLPPWEVPSVIPGDEMTPDQYTKQVVGAANTLTDIKMNQFKADLAKVETYRDDLHYAEATYDILNPDKTEVYDKAASKKIAELYKKASAGDPSLRLKDFVDNIMSFRQEGRNEGMKEITPKVLKQQAEGAIPPSTPAGKRSGDTDTENMSREEMEDYLKANGLWDQ